MKVQDPAVYTIRRETILQHARHLFATKGFSESSMDDLAQACKMQKASLYHYFESKESLLRAMIALERERWITRLNDDGHGNTLSETLRNIATGFLQGMDDTGRREFFTILHFESHKNPWIFKAWKENPTQARDGFHAVFAKHFDASWSRTKISIFITQFMGALVHFATLSKLRQETLCGEVVSDEAYIDQLVETFSRCNG